MRPDETDVVLRATYSEDLCGIRMLDKLAEEAILTTSNDENYPTEINCSE